MHLIIGFIVVLVLIILAVFFFYKVQDDQRKKIVKTVRTPLPAINEPDSRYRSVTAVMGDTGKED